MFDQVQRLENMGKEIAVDSAMRGELQRLRESLESEFNAYYTAHRSELKELLEQEIISRYYYRAGRLAHSLARDTVLIRSEELLRTPDSIQHILQTVSPIDMRRESARTNKKKQQVG